jgi:CheY-like chemotaxis protein
LLAVIGFCLLAQTRAEVPPLDDRIKTRLLVVDDEEVMVAIIFSMLSPLGYEIATALDGQGAISRSRDFKPNFCILNVVMPRMSGLEAALEITKVLPECKIIFTTSTLNIENPEFRVKP